jgi:hypothetical protein
MCEAQADHASVTTVWEVTMTRIIPRLTLLAVLLALWGCVNPADLPRLGGFSGYQRAIDQDVSATRDSGAVVQSGNLLTRLDFR